MHKQTNTHTRKSESNAEKPQISVFTASFISRSCMHVCMLNKSVKIDMSFSLSTLKICRLSHTIAFFKNLFRFFFPSPTSIHNWFRVIPMNFECHAILFAYLFSYWSFEINKKTENIHEFLPMQQQQQRKKWREWYKMKTFLYFSVALFSASNEAKYVESSRRIRKK